MRKFLLASVATLGTGGLMSAAFAQAPAGGPTQGQAAYPLANPTSYVNNNNNYQAPAIPGALANPTPGTIVIHVNGKVQTTFQSEWTNSDTHLITAGTPNAAQTGNGNAAPLGSPGATALTVVVPAVGSTLTIPTTPLQTSLGANGIGVVKVNPYALDAFMRLYFGADAMATNGLRYGAAIELRENFTGQISSNTSSGASADTSLSTVFVRRAFTYFAGEQWGIVRFGIGDGPIGIFDNGVTTGQFLINGFNGGDNQNVPSAAAIPFFFLAQAGAEYGNAKLVYLSPQIAGFDFGVQWAPNTANGYGISSTFGGLANSLTGSGIGTGSACGPAQSGCPTLSSGPGIQDGSRATNQTVLGVRYQGTMGGLGVLAYAAWEHSGAVDYTGLQTAAILGTTNFPGSKFTGKYDGLNFGSGGAALTFGGFTLSANAIGGALNGQGALRPTGGASEAAVILGLKWTSGPLTVGVEAEKAWYQGNVVLSGLTQRAAQGIAVGGNYVVAPGFTVFAEYMYEQVYQGANNFVTGVAGTNAAAIAAGSLANNTSKAQGFLLGNVINF